MTESPYKIKKSGVKLWAALLISLPLFIWMGSSCTLTSTAAGITLVNNNQTNSESTYPVELTVNWPSPAGTHPPYLIFRTDRLYTPWHLWVKQESEDTARIGITYYGQIGLGALEDMGMIKGDSFGCFFVGDDCMIYDFPAPVNGQVIQVNEDIVKDNWLINSSPYDDGWMIEIKIEDPAEFDSLMAKEAYINMLKG